MARWSWAWVLALLAVIGIVAVQVRALPATRPTSMPAAPASQPSAEVLGLIAQLGAASAPDRDRAAAELVKRGPAAEPALLESAKDSPDKAVRSRITSVVARIDNDQPDSPTYITLHVKDASGGNVLKEISSQTNVKVVGWPEFFWNGQQQGLIPRVTLDLDHVPFWTAIEAVCKMTKCRPQFVGMGQPTDISLMSGKSGPWFQAGQFAFMPTMISHSRQIDLIDGNITNSDSLFMTFYIDPKIQLTGFALGPLTLAEDENGLSLIPTQGAKPGEMGSQNQIQPWAIRVSVPLTLPPHVGKKLARLEGTITAQISTGFENLEIPDLAKAMGAPTIAAHHQVEVQQCKLAAPNLLSLSLKISRLAGAAESARGLFQEIQSAHIVDANGQQLLPEASVTGSADKIEWKGNFLIIKPSKGPFSLQWKISTSGKSLTVPFVLKDLELPPH